MFLKDEGSFCFWKVLALRALGLPDVGIIFVECIVDSFKKAVFFLLFWGGTKDQCQFEQ